MESVLGIIQSPFFIGVVLFLGIIALARLMLMRDPSLKRGYGSDRRQLSKMPVVPFYDSEGILVTEDRRTCIDRRRARLLEREHSINSSHQANI
ncbi:MAG: hypothetical protein OEZ33_05800 [Gammaproteobacteria bacterium]|nr:hypothetical protein [Gammaproteobacteria bacterium]